MAEVKGPASRGISSKKALWFEYDNLPMSLGARWELEDITKLVFPPHLQKAQYDLAVALLKLVGEQGEVDGDLLAAWQHASRIPNSTLRNLVIPKLVRCGLLARERKNPTGQSNKDKRHHMVLKLSARFGEAFKHVGVEWSTLVETFKEKKRRANKLPDASPNPLEGPA